MKRVILTYVHGLLDYPVAVVLFLAPYIFGFDHRRDAAVYVPQALAVVVVLQSLCTRYEAGLFKLLPMRAHLMLDYLASIFLAASPWIFGFVHAPKNVWVPHVAAGVMVFLVSMMTERVPRKEPTVNREIRRNSQATPTP